MHHLAGFLTLSCWKELQSAILDAKVKHTQETLGQDFNRRLEEKIREFIGKYATMEGRVKYEAEKHAREARNEALNLKCPHCETVYDEFDGCMALQCQTCKKGFCGYCHKGFLDSRGTHNHVRE